MEQLTLFESEEVSPLSKEDMVYQIGDDVKVRKVQENEPLDPEDFYYLKDFSNKKGIILSAKTNSQGKECYEVGFDRDVKGYFYSGDLILL
ncbi:hypothetical protein LG291_25115 (plasmid) [Cytobacillus firmus]|uniref:hypothetical protein n=1 Tax=Bacillaceae TaxID=186817 RepID=UPI001A8D11FB|nr:MULTISPECIES: hypothetical protein [Bacillaceae]MBN8203882.1 hypothetical protein [Bacillus sp. NTK034]